MLSGMAQGELSEECKQKLRNIDYGLANATELLLGGASLLPPALAYNLIDSFYAIQTVDDPCAQVHRQIDQSAGAMSLVSRLQAGFTSPTRFDQENLLQHISRIREEIEFHLRQN